MAPPVRAAGDPVAAAEAAARPSPPRPTAPDPKAWMDLLIGFLAGSRDHIAIKDATGRYLFVNEASAEWFGFPIASIVGRTNADLWGEDEAARIAEHDRALLRDGQRMEYEEVLTKDGVTRTWDTTKDVIRDPTGTIVAFGSIAREITDRVEAEQALGRSDEALRQNLLLLNGILDSTADHIAVKGLDGRYLLVNRAIAEWYGATPEAMIGRTYGELHDAEGAAASAARDKELLESGVGLNYVETLTRHGTTRTWLTTSDVIRDVAGQVVAFYAVSREVTEFKRAGEQSQQAQRMEAVGQLAGGIAHDFNNLLTAIRGYTDLVRDRLPAELAAEAEDLEQVALAADRAAELVRQLLAFSRRQVLSPRVLEPAMVLADVAPLLRRLLGEHVELVTNVTDPDARVRVDPSQLEQVIVNLAVNARDAMPDGGRLTIEIARADLDAGFVRLHPGSAPGSHVVLTVSDTGTGMDAATQAHIFEPFFTTKEVGKGTGMGLATVFGIVKQSGGYVEVASEPGRGTTFRIFLPEVIDESPAMVGPGNPPTRRALTGTETILLVEDEEAVRQFGRRSLEKHGYVVLEAAKGADAVALADAYHGQIALLVTDAVMPGLQGHQVAEHITATRPDMRVLYVSGFTEDSVIHRGLVDQHIAFLGKPFTSEGLCEAVRRVLDTDA